MTEEVIKPTVKTLRIVRSGLGIIKRNPQIAFYPYLAVPLFALTFPLANTLLYLLWNHFAHSTIFSAVDNTPHELRILLGLVTFSVFYASFIASFFTCAAAAEVIAKLEGRDVSRTYGLQIVRHRFWRITRFGLLGVFFFPLAIVAQRKKLPHGIIGVVGSSFSVHMPMLASEVVSGNKGVLKTISEVIQTLGPAWREGIVLRGILLASIVPVLALSTGSRLIESSISNPDVARTAGWLIGILIFATGYIALRVIGTVFTTTLYMKAKSGRGDRI